MPVYHCEQPRVHGVHRAMQSQSRAEEMHREAEGSAQGRAKASDRNQGTGKE